MVLGVVAVTGIGLLAASLLPKGYPESYDTDFVVGESLLRVEVARTFFEKYRGLSGRESMCDECGMLFVFNEASTQHLVMRDMKFALDFVFIKDSEVVEIRQNIKFPLKDELPSRVSSTLEVDLVLELNAGVAHAAQIEIGDSVAVDLGL